jgi:DNA (cytosine-5)-methyltransferase 1
VLTKRDSSTMSYNFYEFFAGGGMARAGLGADWQCLFANDFDPMKAATYAANWGPDHLVCDDVANIKPADLSGVADLVWASFPCQDLSLAGTYRGLGTAASKVMTRSGTFWPFWGLMRALKQHGRAPRMIVLENVTGAITSRDGKDFAAICTALVDVGYRVGAIVIDARHFVPQSRQRVFFIAVAPDIDIPKEVLSDGPVSNWHPPALIEAQRQIEDVEKLQWLWWNLPVPAKRTSIFADLIDENPDGCDWHTIPQSQKILAMMAPHHLAKIERARRSGGKVVGTVYKRTREERGVRQQRAEVRFDDVAGCLRTPGGGSSRQTIIVVEGDLIRSRLLAPREAARLMGLNDSYKLPERYNDAYHVAGDGVCVPVVTHIATSLLEPVLDWNCPDRFMVAAE